MYFYLIVVHFNYFIIGTKYLTEAYAVQAVDGTGLEVSNSIRTQYRQNYLEVNIFLIIMLFC